jgi:hypothetical protein
MYETMRVVSDNQLVSCMRETKKLHFAQESFYVRQKGAYGITTCSLAR